MRCLGWAAVAALVAAPALADPCTAIPDRGPGPAFLHPGAAITGPVVYVGDGDSLCVAVGPRAGRDWVEIRLSDFYAPELHSPAGPAAKVALERIALGKRLQCDLGRQSYDRVVGACRLNGQPLGALLKAAGGQEGGRGW